jgi:hypothetical protein
MTFTAIMIEMHGVAPGWSFLAHAHPLMFDEVSAAAAALLTLTGVVLNWSLPRRRMSIEEHLKDGDMTDEQARQHLRFHARFAPIITVAGVAMLLYVLYDLTN